jgi:hypothetical protein
LPEHYADAEKLAILAAWYAGIRPVGDATPVADAGDDGGAEKYKAQLVRENQP